MSARIQRRLIGGVIALAVLVYGGLGATVLLAPAPAVAVAVEQSAPTPEELERSVVRIKVAGELAGTAFAVGDGTTLLTVAHVAELGSLGPLTAVTADGQEFEVVVEWIAVHDDVAQLRIVGTTLPPLQLRCDLPAVGEDVHIIGHPGGIAWAHTFGRISAQQKSEDEPVLVIDATAWQGNSGSPILDAQGRVVGIVPAGFVLFVAGQPVPIGLTYGVPAARVCELLGR